ncbi:hypothetical protein MPSEU_000746900 [Mayamaea pseudoterrestris]|nr:hypothetical protein MPSEU_000746900 [Mayamaea pseudoterrestris]
MLRLTTALQITWLLLLLPCINGFISNVPIGRQSRQASFPFLAASGDIPSQPSSSSSSANEDDEELAYYESQEVLLRMQLLPTQDDAFDRLQAFIRSFPFAAALPVQPLTYLPTSNGGVEVKFLRKPTDKKPGVDGGIRIFVEQNSDEKILVTAKRNDRGQTCQKIFSERAVVTKLVAALTGQDAGMNLNPADCPPVKVESVFHKWLDAI